MTNIFSLLMGNRFCRALFMTVLVCLDHVSLLVMCVIGKLNDAVGVVPGRAVMSEQGVQEGTEHAPLRSSGVEDQHGECVVTYPYQLFRPRVLSLLMIFEGTMVLNAEL